MSHPDSATRGTVQGQLGGIQPPQHRPQPDRSAGPRSGGTGSNLSCPQWFILGSDDETRRGWVLYCDLEPGHTGDLHYDDTDELWWKTGTAHE